MKIKSVGMLAFGISLCSAGALGGAGAITVFAIGGLPRQLQTHRFEPEFALTAAFISLLSLIIGSASIGAAADIKE